MSSEMVNCQRSRVEFSATRNQGCVQNGTEFGILHFSYKAASNSIVVTCPSDIPLFSIGRRLLTTDSDTSEISTDQRCSNDKWDYEIDLRALTRRNTTSLPEEVTDVIAEGINDKMLSR